MRFLILFLGISAFITSCSSTRSASGSKNNAAVKPAKPSSKFLDNISINGKAAEKTNDKLPVAPQVHAAPKIFFVPTFNIERGEPMQFKYAIKMDVEVERLANSKLYEFIERWWATPYRLGGSTQKGVDCSAFTQTLLSVIYSVQVPRTAHEQKQFCLDVEPEQLKEGDLVFFNTKGKSITHVGVYLQDNNFVHASTSSGVMISSLSESYWSKRYAGAGRVIEEKITDNALIK